MAENWYLMPENQYLFYKIPGRPVTKKNSMRMVKNPKTGKMFPLPSKQYKEYEREAGKHLKQKPDKPIDYPVNVTVLYFLSRNKDGSIPKSVPDLTNLLEATDDLLVHYGILEDDNALIVAGHDGSMVHFINGEPYSRVIIRPIGNVYQSEESKDG
jgi:Holliday junction resolvase RusA-like endonuclease